jgi:hypothetical protein
MPSTTERLAMAALATGFLAVPLIWLGSVAFAVGAVAVLLGAVAYVRAERAGSERIGRSWATLGMLGGMAPFVVAAVLMVASGFGGTPYHVPPFLG